MSNSDFSMPEIPSRTEDELKELYQKNEYEEVYFETLRALNIAILKVTSVIETTDEFAKLRKSVRYKIVLGHISKSIKISMGIMELDSKHKYSECIELLIHFLNKQVIRGIYFIYADDEVISNFLKRSILPLASQHSFLKENDPDSIHRRKVEEIFNKILDEAGLSEEDFTFESVDKLPSLKRMIESLANDSVVVDELLSNSSHFVESDFLTIMNGLILESEGQFVINSKGKELPRFILSAVCKNTSLLMMEYSKKFLTFPETRVLFSDYFQKFQKWSNELTEFSLKVSTSEPKDNLPAKKKQVRNSKIGSHKFTGKKLVPPMLQTINFSFNSWSNERMPEFVWALLLIEGLGRDKALNIFHMIINYFMKNKNLSGDPSFSGISKLDVRSKVEIFQIIFQNDEAKKALKPLLLLESIPDQAYWRGFLGTDFDVNKELEVLANAFWKGLDHQSQESTDCRWLRLASKTAIGKMHFPTEEHYREIFDYPNYNDQRKVRPSIRAAEVGLDTFGVEKKEKEWIHHFWDHLYRTTSCQTHPAELPTQRETYSRIDSPTLWRIYKIISEYYLQKLPGTHIESKHDCLLGSGLYFIDLSLEILDAPSSKVSLLGLRTIAEGIINLKYLLKQNNEEMWKRFRDYGVGQMKLVLLKARESSEVLHMIPLKDLGLIANEDRWEEFSIVDVGDWADENLRARSIKSDLKELYDNYYVWPSSFSHSHWGALRFVSFDVCLNPLHRLHRVPVTPKKLPSAKYDLEILLEKLFSVISDAYGDESLSFLKLLEEAREDGYSRE